jgi:hypothetical protein
MTRGVVAPLLGSRLPRPVRRPLLTHRREPGMWHAYLVFAGLPAEADVAVAEPGAALRADCAA